jgi:hypothetical protein
LRFLFLLIAYLYPCSQPRAYAFSYLFAAFAELTPARADNPSAGIQVCF